MKKLIYPMAKYVLYKNLVKIPVIHSLIGLAAVNHSNEKLLSYQIGKQNRPPKTKVVKKIFILLVKLILLPDSKKNIAIKTNKT